MQIHHRHGWDLSPREAIALQNALRQEVSLHDELPPIITRVAGVDVGFEQGGTITRAAVAVLDYPSLSLIESRIARQPTRFPFVNSRRFCQRWRHWNTCPNSSSRMARASLTLADSGLPHIWGF